MQMSHPVLGRLPCAVRLQAHLMSHVTDTAAEQKQLAVDSNMAHSRALSSIPVTPFDSGNRAIIIPASHAKAGGGSLHAPGQAVALTTVPNAVFAGQVRIPNVCVPVLLHLTCKSKKLLQISKWICIAN